MSSTCNQLRGLKKFLGDREKSKDFLARYYSTFSIYDWDQAVIVKESHTMTVRKMFGLYELESPCLDYWDRNTTMAAVFKRHTFNFTNVDAVHLYIYEGNSERVYNHIHNLGIPLC